VAITAEMADLAAASLTEARAVAANARRGLRRAGGRASGKAQAALGELEVLIGRLDQVVAQTRQRVRGDMPDSATRLVSLHDPDARPIKKGRIGKPVEFGFLAQVLDNPDGVVVDHSVHLGNPPDGPLLAPAIDRIKNLLGRAPREVAADRGYGAAAVDAALTAAGVGFVAIVRKGRQGAARRAVERAGRFRRLIKWRTGSEGRISALKRGYGWNRSLMDGVAGTRTWCGYGVFTHNATKISGLIAAQSHNGPTNGAPTPSPPRAGPGPPGPAQPPPAQPLSA
jgi:IS5 family transposase